MLSGIEGSKYAFHIKKEYEHLRPVLIDKVKLLQILVNLIQNAKDSLIESTNENKFIKIKIVNSDKRCLSISISDNDLGIPKENFIKIFGYGFTTKKTGHGFGLHTSAILAKELNGVLKVNSEGSGKGATFTLNLPYKHQ